MSPLYNLLGHQLHTYVPLIDVVQLEAFMDSCDITDRVWINKKIPKCLGRAQFNYSINFYGKNILFIKVHIRNGQICSYISSFEGLGNRHLNYVIDSAVVMYYVSV